VRIGINTRLALRCGIPFSFIWAAHADQVFSENSLVEGVHLSVAVELAQRRERSPVIVARYFHG
jgi:hypothetical protein